MKIRGWIGVALCMITFGAGAQEDTWEVGDWTIELEPSVRRAKTQGDQHSQLGFSCNKEMGCLFSILSTDPCLKGKTTSLTATSGKIRKDIKVFCIHFDWKNQIGYARLVENGNDLKDLINKGNTLTIASPSNLSETFSLNGAKDAVQFLEWPSFYSLQDGFLYGYEKSTKGKNASENAPPEELVMFNYAGKNNDIYQVFSKEGSSTFVRECKRPCEFIKLMIFDYSNRAIKTSRLRMKEHTILHAVMIDAMRGQLMPTIITDDNGTEHSIWFDEREGMILTPIAQ